MLIVISELFFIHPKAEWINSCTWPSLVGIPRGHIHTILSGRLCWKKRMRDTCLPRSRKLCIILFKEVLDQYIFEHFALFCWNRVFLIWCWDWSSLSWNLRPFPGISCCRYSKVPRHELYVPHKWKNGTFITSAVMLLRKFTRFTKFLSQAEVVDLKSMESSMWLLPRNPGSCRVLLIL